MSELANEKSMPTTRIGILGCGMMGTALLEGWITKLHSPTTNCSLKFGACVRSDPSLERLKQHLQKVPGFDEKAFKLVAGSQAAVSIAADADVVVLGCAPGDLGQLAKTPGLITAMKGKIIVSLLAGSSCRQIRNLLEETALYMEDWQIIRVIPTLGAKVCDSVSLVAGSVDTVSSIEQPHIRIVDTLFQMLGVVQYVPEQAMDELTALGAVCHALALEAVDTLADAGAADGLSRPVALPIAAHCLRSASGLLSGGMSPQEMKSAMAIPKGITINSILNVAHVRPVLADATRKAIAHTKRMS